jgi:hypothetical protein
MVSSSSLFAPAIGMTIVEFLHGVYLGAQGRAPKHFIALTFFCAHYLETHAYSCPLHQNQ